ncbi:MAG: flagellar hook-associated protein 3 [Treponemataceae bacterium]|nr:MAG: flagellar hook-associated protein 3 [Treponemataceae bacterium]
MHRVSTRMPSASMQYQLRGQESRLNKVNNQIGSQQKIPRLRDDPIAAGHAVRYNSYLTRVQQFEKNAKTLVDQFSFAEGYMRSSLDIVHRVRELAVQSANGTYSSDDLRLMSAEVDELLKQLVQNANETDSDGNALFAGTRTKGAAFEVVMGGVSGAAEPMITEVRYAGNISTNNVEVDERAYLPVDRAGNRIFWAERQHLTALSDASGYRVPFDGLISVDGVEIAVTAGDNARTIAAKINTSGASVKAGIDPITQGLMMSTTDSRQLWLQDIQGSVLNDLGIIGDASQRPPNNIAPMTARVSGGSLFDTVIALRDAMLSGDQETIGGRVLGAIEQGFANLNERTALIGSRYERAMSNVERNSLTALNTAQQLARESDLDAAQAIMDLKMMETVNQATMSTAARLYSNTILNYMR